MCLKLTPCSGVSSGTFKKMRECCKTGSGIELNYIAFRATDLKKLFMTQMPVAGKTSDILPAPLYVRRDFILFYYLLFFDEYVLFYLVDDFIREYFIVVLLFTEVTASFTHFTGFIRIT
jgi:hypothetical protein